LVKLTEGSALPEGFRNVDFHVDGNLYLELYAVNAYDGERDGVIIIIIIIIILLLLLLLLLL
jgi:hypothetical protein